MSVTRWRLRPLIFFAASYPLGPPCGEVFTDCESRIAVVGFGARCCRVRHSLRSSSYIASNRPRASQRRKVLYTACQGGKSLGSIRQEQPERRT